MKLELFVSAKNLGLAVEKAKEKKKELEAMTDDEFQELAESYVKAFTYVCTTRKEFIENWIAIADLPGEEDEYWDMDNPYIVII